VREVLEEGEGTNEERLRQYIENGQYQMEIEIAQGWNKENHRYQILPATAYMAKNYVPEMWKKYRHHTGIGRNREGTVETRGTPEEYEEECECEYGDLAAKIMEEVTVRNTRTGRLSWTSDTYREAMLYMTRMPVAMVPAILEIDVGRLRKVAAKIARIMIACTTKDTEGFKDDGNVDRIITGMYIKGVFAIVSAIVALLLTEVAPREEDQWHMPTINAEGEEVKQWRGISRETVGDPDFWTNAMHQFHLMREMKYSDPESMDPNEMNRYTNWDPRLPACMVWSTMPSKRTMEDRQKRPWRTELNAVRIKMPVIYVPSIVAKLQMGTKMGHTQRAWAELKQTEQIAAGLNKTETKTKRVMESARIVGTKLDAKATVGLEDILARMGAATVVKEYLQTTPEEMKEKVQWPTIDGKEPEEERQRRGLIKSTPMAKATQLPMQVAMHVKLQLPRTQGEMDPAKAYEGIREWPIKENITENPRYDEIGTNGGVEPRGALYRNAAYNEIVTMLPQGAECKTLILRQGMALETVDLGRKDKPIEDQQWEDAVEVARKLRSMYAVKGAGEEKTISEYGSTIVRMHDMVGIGGRLNYENTRLWDVNWAGEGNKSLLQKVQRERQAPRAWQEPFDSKLTLDTLAERDVWTLFGGT
jgi:hypothetical protein